MRKKPENEQVAFLKKLVEDNVRAIVEHEDAIRIDCDEMPMRLVFSIWVHDDDVGLALGGEGKTIDAVRRIVWTACKKTNFKVDLDVVTTMRR